MVKKFNDFINENKQYNILDIAGLSYDKLFSVIQRSYNDDERSKEELNWYLEKIDNLYHNGGEIYRLIFHYDEKYINKDDLGEHWGLDEYMTMDLEYSLKDGANESDYLYTFIDDDGEEQYFTDIYDDSELKTFFVIATIPPKFIKLSESISQFVVLPYENEINLINSPKNYKIEEIKDGQRI